MPKTGTKSVHTALATLGLKVKYLNFIYSIFQKFKYHIKIKKCFIKVFDAHNLNDFAKQLDDFGRGKTTFFELAKIFEENKFDVIIEPAAIMWTFMVDHWPKTKFIHVTRDHDEWEKSFQ